MRFQQKPPPPVEAVQFHPDKWRDVERFVGDDIARKAGTVQAVGNWKHENDVLCILVRTDRTDPKTFNTIYETAMPGDWIVRDQDGVYSVVKAETFEARFAVAEERTP